MAKILPTLERMIEKIQIWGSLQAHRVMENIEGGGKKIIPFCDERSYIPSRLDIMGTVRQTFGHSALRNGWKLIEIYEDTPGNTEGLG